jgi:hypothetical protein
MAGLRITPVVVGQGGAPDLHVESIARRAQPGREG